MANELPSDANTLTANGDALGVALTANTEITAGYGVVAGTGNVVIGVYYIMADDGGA